MNLFVPAETAKLLHTSESTLAKWRLRGCGPPFVKIGPRAVGYPMAELEEWLRSNLQTSTSGTGKGGRKPKMTASPLSHEAGS